jgi:outer membrane cobalamin receptor
MKLHLMKSIFAVLCCIFAITVSGQITINGTIIDKLSKEPVAGAVIIANDADAVTVSQINGFFRLNLPQGVQKVMITLVGYTQKEIEVTKSEDLGTIELETDALELEKVMIVASFAKDRETPVAISTIKPEIIAEKLGSKEFPEILRSTPSVYITKSGGGYGDSRIGLRGFDSNNIGILVNGVPVNDMESGKVYWSNWAGLADVTRVMQVQRGMGASKLGLSSVGGTINIITKNTDAEKGGSVYSGFGNDGYNKYSFNLSTGLMENGWAVSIAGGTTFGDGYIDGTNFRAYSYFANISKVISPKHRLSLQAFGAPQWHNQRGSQHKISTYNNENPDVPFHVNNKKFNSDYGYRNGKAYGSNYGYNEFHKPQISLNHYWDIDETSSLSTVAYVSVGTGGGRRISGRDERNSGLEDYRYKMTWYEGTPTDVNYLTHGGILNFDKAIEVNSTSDNGSKMIVGNAFNNHEWYGLLSTYNKAINNFKIIAGIDAKYYIGKHGMEIVDLLGGEYYLDNAYNANRLNTALLKVGDKYSYHNDGIVSWLGVFGQAEYVKEQYSAFVSASVASNNYRRKDYFNYTSGNQLSDKVPFTPFSVKGGFNYNLNKHNNVFINAGYFTRTPFFDAAFLNYKNDINKGTKMEKIVSGEIGYGFISAIFSAKLNAYITNWKDRTLTKQVWDRENERNLYANIYGVNALHKGVELEMQFNPVPRLLITGMCSLGDWVWQDNADYKYFDDNQTLTGTGGALSLKDIHVGNSAQHTAFLGIDYDVFKSIKIGANVNYFGKHFAEFDPINRTTADNNNDSWRLPDATVVDLNVRWKFNIAGLDAVLYGNVDNLFDKEYISDATDGSNHDRNTAIVYYGFGRTWNAGVRINF